MTFAPINLAKSFPARKSTAPIDVEAANALVTMLNENGAVSDGQSYESENKARSAASKAKRLASAATVELPKGKVLRTRVATPNGAKAGTFAFALSLADAPKASK